MIVKFQRPETIVCELEVRTAAGVLTTPSSIPKLTVTDPLAAAVVDNQSMTEVSVGNYTHDYTPGATAELGWYSAKFTVTDGGRVTIKQDGFDLEAS